MCGVPRQRSRSGKKGLPVWVHLIAAIIVIALVQNFVVRTGRVPSGSMEMTLKPRQIIAADRVSIRWNPVSNQDVVVFTADESWRGEIPTVDSPGNAVRWFLGVLGFGSGLDMLMVKRVVGVGGQQVSCCDAEGRLTVDGTPIDEPYVYEDYEFVPGTLDCSSGSERCFDPIDVPEGKLLVLGDHRSRSADSVYLCRVSDESDCVRFVDESDVVGRVLGVGRP